jgi:hypothetical protein
MSGYKRATVKISEEEYRRLQQADMKRRFTEHRKQSRPSNQAADLSDSLREMETRQRRLEETLNGLGQEFNSIGVELAQELVAQNARCYEGLTAMIEEVASDTNASLAAVSQRFTDELEREREQHQHQLQSVLQRLHSYEQRERSKVEAARLWLRQAAALADFIQQQFDHERFAPGQLSRLLSRLNFAQNNLAGGFFESSLQTSQQAFLALSELHVELEHRIAEWQMEYARAKGALSKFVFELEANARVSAVGLEGEELSEQVDLAYWSGGKYHELLDKSRQLLRLLSQEQQTISTEELRRTYGELLPVVEDRFESIIYEARLNALNSQLRMNIAERALQALEIQGFKLSGAGYANQDMRAAFTASLENFDGSRVLIEVMPTGTTKPDLINELVVITNHPHLRTEHEARLQWQELCRSLGQYDLQVGRPEVRATPPPTASTPAVQPAVTHTPIIRSKRHHHV